MLEKLPTSITGTGSARLMAKAAARAANTKVVFMLRVSFGTDAFFHVLFTFICPNVCY